MTIRKMVGKAANDIQYMILRMELFVFIACDMAAKNQRVDLVRQFLDDPDGHVRKLAYDMVKI